MGSPPLLSAAAGDWQLRGDAAAPPLPLPLPLPSVGVVQTPRTVVAGGRGDSIGGGRGGRRGEQPVERNACAIVALMGPDAL